MSFYSQITTGVTDVSETISVNPETPLNMEMNEIRILIEPIDENVPVTISDIVIHVCAVPPGKDLCAIQCQRYIDKTPHH